ncbi:hypothetical protein M094_3957 [Bacteroides uniformis str. 3978 T3 ii]|uniref:Uncharacterized protein n=1 Tax=Bacteroides uniformis str. 3978 T3 ii TaxID=1339349 RepID=A0A078S9N5_BACUN|nr:hypothetical protein M094_3957 [Bacteroides uniformis str. 3978 T3 ii]
MFGCSFGAGTASPGGMPYASPAIPHIGSMADNNNSFLI